MRYSPVNYYRIGASAPRRIARRPEPYEQWARRAVPEFLLGAAAGPWTASRADAIRIKAGSVADQPGHIVDIMATLLDVSGTEYPETFGGAKLRPLRGRSLVPVLEGRTREPHPEIFFEFAKYKGLRAGKWKISWQKGPWELYDIEADRTELNDLAKKMPDKVEALAARHEAWLKDLGGGGAKQKGRKSRRK